MHRWIAVLLLGVAALADEPAFHAARELEEQGKHAEAFIAYLKIPGAEHRARAIGQAKPEEFLRMLDPLLGDPATAPAAMLVACDLRLGSQTKERSIECYRAVAARIGGSDGYFVEPPPDGPFGTLELPPFSAGPGSHRDNWLVRRFLALEAWDDAAREFARVRALHDRRMAAKPIDGVAMEFFLDYAFFLRQRGRSDEALAMLIDIAARRDPEPQNAMAFYDGGGWRNAGVSEKEFIRLVYGVAKQAGAEGQLVTRLEREVAEGSPRARRMLARVRSMQGDVEGALALDLASARDAAGRAQVLVQYGRTAQAIETLEKALEKALPTSDDQSPLLESLHRLYVASGDARRAFEIRLRIFEAVPAAMGNIDSLERDLAAWKASGLDPRFREWAARRVASTKDPSARAVLHWILGNPGGTIAAVADFARANRHSGYHSEWKKRFAELGPAMYRKLLAAIVEANPDEIATAIELFDRDGVADGPAYARTLERMLAAQDSNVSYAMQRHPNPGRAVLGARRAEYTLARLYAKSGDVDRLVANAVRIARSDQTKYLMTDEVRGDLSAAIALAIEHASDPRHLAALEEALVHPVWAPQRAQLERVKAGGWPRADIAPRDFGWMNLPPGVRALASNETVTALAVKAEGTVIAAGHPWGVSVYDGDGNPVTRIATGGSVAHIAVIGQTLWIAAKGLLRADLREKTIARVESGAEADDASIDGFAARGNELWIAHDEEVHRLDPSKDELRIFTQEELGFDHDPDLSSFLFDGESVWVSGREGSRRFDPKTQRWEAPVSVEHPEANYRVMQIIDGALFAHELSDNREPKSLVIVDRETLATKPIPIHGTPQAMECGGALSWVGRSEGRLVFGDCLVFDAASGALQRLPKGAPFVRASLHENARRVELPGGRSVYGIFPGRGVHLVAADGTSRHISAGFADTLPGDAVHARIAAPDASQTWLLTAGGIAVVDDSDRVVRTITSNDGLPFDAVPGGAIGEAGRVYLAAGGLTVYDPRTRVFTSLKTPDGLAAEVVTGVRRDGETIVLSFGIDQDRQGHSYRTFDPQTFDPRTGRFGPIVEHPLSSNSLPFTEAPDTPLLGGRLISTATRGEQTVHLGGHGLLISRGTLPQMEEALYAVRTVRETEGNPEEAEMADLDYPLPEQRLLQFLAHRNPYVIAEAVVHADAQTLSPKAIARLGQLVRHPQMRVRASVVYVLSNSKHAEAVEPLKTARGDRTLAVRSLAAQALAERGVMSPPALYKPILIAQSMGNYPYGAISTIGVEVSKEKVLPAIAAHADRELLALILEHAPHRQTVEYSMSDLYARIGGSVARNPELADILLQARDTEPYSRSRTDLAERSLAAAGRAILPRLLAALQSDDRVVRSNAARALGTMGDRSAIQPLIDALDLESGLARASIVGALGNLRAKEALPRLVALFTDAKNEDPSRRGAGFRASQAEAVLTSDYAKLASLDEVAADWRNLRSGICFERCNPLPDEPLLDPQMVLAAMANIGPESLQDFYRSLTAEHAFAVEAARQLARAATPADREQNVRILQTLLSNQWAQTAAAVSLLELGEDEPVRPLILGWISGTNEQKRHEALRELARVRDARKIELAREPITKIASDPATPRYIRDAATAVLKMLSR